MKICDYNALEQIKNNYNENISSFEKTVLVCAGAGCVSSNCGAVSEAFKEEVSQNGFDDKIKVIETGCMGLCAVGPVMLVLPERIFYTNLDAVKAREIFSSHILKGEIIEQYTYYDPSLESFVPKIDDIEFYKAQVKIVLDNCGLIDYSDINAYIAKDGYKATYNALCKSTPEDVIEEIKISGLRGRGGAGFPTHIKWSACNKMQSDEKYIVCNADEGDPGAFMDRSIIEGDPHSVLEGMMLGAYAIGASTGYVYIRAEYPIAIERLKIAIEQARAAGLLGENIFSSGFNFNVEIRIGAGAFVCGEETALIASIEGQRGEPKQKPPFPFESGINGKPTIINNVETIANVPKILLKGGAWYAGFGLPEAPGTKVFALAGQVVNTGIIEVPIGISLGDIIYKVGAGIRDGKKFKAAQMGGPSGGCITKENLNTPIDYESLKKLGAIMGSGGLIVMNEDTCMVDTARFFMDFIREESCGKCVACRIGTKRMLEILENITDGKGKEGDIELLESLSKTIQDTAMCGLGQTAPNPILSTIENFREEYEEHINKKRCSAGVCASMFISPCENTCPANINIPGYISLIASGRFIDAYNLIMRENPFPAVCGRICTRPCEQKCRRAGVDESVAIRDLKRFAADYAFKNELPYSMQLSYPKNGKKVAVVGAGASGLTCAYYLVRIGYDVDVFESESVAGGVLSFGIPEYRLPKDILSHEIDLIKQAGVNIHLNTAVGKDVEFAKLRQEYGAIYLATGTQFPQKVNIDGEDLDGVLHGISFLKSVFNENPRFDGKTVCVIGGGNTAIDSARTALRIGAEKVIILYRRTRDAMPAYKEEIIEAVEEGVEILELVSPVKILEGKDGKVSGVQCKKMTLGDFDSSGRRKSISAGEEEFIIDCDIVIPAVSQYADLPFIKKEDIGTTSWGTFIVNADTLMTTMDGVFAGGDVARGPDDVIRAIADGKQAAVAIDKYLGGKGELNKGAEIDIPQIVDEDEVVYHEQFPKEILDPDKRNDNFEEVVKGFHKINALAESMRCLHCDRR